MFEVLKKISNKIANETGKHLSFCWNVINPLFGSIPEYSAQFKLDKYTDVIESTGIIARSRFTEWFILNSAKFLVVKKISTESPYVMWVFNCFKEILKNLEMMDKEKVDYGRIETISDNISTINELLQMLMPEDIAQKLKVKNSKLKKVADEFKNSRIALYKLLVRHVPESKLVP